jgi:hypothetical protein
MWDTKIAQLKLWVLKSNDWKMWGPNVFKPVYYIKHAVI